MSSYITERHFNNLRLRRAFDRRAVCFAQMDFLPREVAQRMLEHLAPIKLSPQHILDIGCAVGGALPSLQKAYPNAHVIGVDWSTNMLAHASAPKSLFAQLTQRIFGHRQHWVQADWSYLPCASTSIDLVWSNFSLHWTALPHQALKEWARVLRPEGLLMLSTLGPDSLKELRAAFAQVDHAMHIPAFVDMHDVGDMLSKNGLTNPVMDAEYLTITYETPKRLLDDVRALGIYPGIDGVHALRGRLWQQRLYAALEEQRHSDDGLIHLSFELVYGHGWKLAGPTSAADEAGIVHIHPSQIARR